MQSGGALEREGVYRPRNPRASPLWQCAQRHGGELREAGRFQRVVEERAIERFIECGDPHHGFARINCDACGHDYLLAFSCKTRYFCKLPSVARTPVRRVGRGYRSRARASPPVRLYRAAARAPLLCHAPRVAGGALPHRGTTAFTRVRRGVARRQARTDRVCSDLRRLGQL